MTPLLVPDRNGSMHDPRQIADDLDDQGDRSNAAIGELLYDAADVVRGLAARNEKTAALLQQLLDLVDAKNVRGEPALGDDPTGAVNWLLDFAEDVRPFADSVVRAS